MSDTHAQNPDDLQHRRPHSHDHPARPAYFTLGEIVLRVEHEIGFDNWKNFLNNLNEQVVGVAKQRFEIEIVSVETEKPYRVKAESKSDVSYRRRISETARNKDGRTHSVVLVSVERKDRANKPDVHEDGEENGKAPDKAVVDLVNNLNDPKNNKAITPRATLEAASPNWLFCGATHSFGDGGPGGWPVPVLQVSDTSAGRPSLVSAAQVDVALNSASANVNISSGSGGNVHYERPVNVVIFDTAPRMELDEIYQQFPDHRILATLRHKLTLIRAKDLSIPLPPDPDEDPHHYIHKDEYDMSDHGLFIAGTIHEWAPNANIYLVEVLNRYGVCTLNGLTCAINALADRKFLFGSQRDLPLIVNCSLCIGFSDRCMKPPAAERKPGQSCDVELHALDRYGNPLKANPYVLHDHHQLMKPVQEAFNRLDLAYDEMRVIAAAGNDGVPSDPLQQARYPAAFDCIVGVGSVKPGNGDYEWYSNLADEPPLEGLKAFGGASQFNQQNPGGIGKAERWGETLPGTGMLGIFVSGFPDATTGDPVNRHPSGNNAVKGWAWWSGTSFATGEMSGIFARAAGRGWDISCKQKGAGDLRELIKQITDEASKSGKS